MKHSRSRWSKSSASPFLLALLAPACANLPGGESEPETVQLDLQGVQATQETGYWCWAACCEMLLRHAGEDASQREIAERIHGYEDDGQLKVETATRYELYQALAPGAEVASFDELWESLEEQLDAEIDTAARQVAAGEKPKQLRDLTIELNDSAAVEEALDRFFPRQGLPIEELLAGNPGVAGLSDEPSSPNGHLYLVTGASFRAKRSVGGALKFCNDLGKVALGTRRAEELGQKLPDEEDVEKFEAIQSRFGTPNHDVETVYMIDPYLVDDADTVANEMQVEMDFDEFLKKVRFVTTRSDAEEILTRWNGLARLEAGQ